jgi:hypothetical protein
MKRNKRSFYYALYVGKNELLDEYGNTTGQYKVLYSNPIKCEANSSAGDGTTESQPFGNSISYDKVIVMDNPKHPINEDTILWVDTQPVINADGSTKTPHDYIVKKVARSLNSVSIAVSKVLVR